MDRPGVRLAATAGSPPERNLSGLVTRAEVVRVANNADLVPLLAAGQVEALASNRPNVLAFAAQVPGARVLADRYAVQPQRLILAPGRSAASLALASAVTRQALASGLIRASIARHGVQGVQPAAAGRRAGCPGPGGRRSRRPGSRAPGWSRRRWACWRPVSEIGGPGDLARRRTQQNDAGLLTREPLRQAGGGAGRGRPRASLRSAAPGGQDRPG